MWIARFHAVALLVGVLATTGLAYGACTDLVAVTASRSAIDDACPCASSTSRGPYVACATQVVKARIAGGELSASCRRDALRHAKLSVCGRPGAAVCCRLSTTNGREKHRVVPRADRCAGTPRVSACVSAFQSVPSGCDSGGCIEPVCGNGVIEPGEACDPIDLRRCDDTCQLIECPLPPATCGNGVVDPGEACEPPGAGACDAHCQPASCGPALPGEIAVACAEPALTSAVSLAASSDGDGFLIAWTARAQRTRTDVLARRFDADVTPIDPTVRVLSDEVPCGITGSYQPAVGSDGQAYYATWVSGGSVEPSGATYSMVSGRRIDADGTARATDELAWTPEVGMCRTIMQGPTAVAGAGVDRFVAAWSRSFWCAIGGTIPAPDASILTFAGSGAPTRRAFGISPDGISVTAATLASLGDDTIAVWRAAGTNPTPPPSQKGLILERWTDPALGGLAILADGDGVGGGRPVAVAGDGQLLVAWTQVLPPSIDRIVATRIASTGEALDPTRIVVATAASGVAAGPVAAFDGTVWLGAWIEPNGSSFDLRAVAVRADGTVVDSTPRVLASDVLPTEPAAASAGDGRVLVVYGRADGAATAIRGALVPGV
jgi:hypothetical protein